MAEQRCENCLFWIRLEGWEPSLEERGVQRNNFGECRRFPPAPSGDDTEGEFAITESGIWCGEWQDDDGL